MRFCFKQKKVLLQNTVHARYLEHSLSRTFSMSNFFLGPLNSASNFTLNNHPLSRSPFISNFHYVELFSRSLELIFARYLELSFEFSQKIEQNTFHYKTKFETRHFCYWRFVMAYFFLSKWLPSES